MTLEQLPATGHRAPWMECDHCWIAYLLDAPGVVVPDLGQVLRTPSARLALMLAGRAAVGWAS